MRIKRRVILLIIILITIGIISLAYTFLFTPEFEEIDMHLTIGDHLGFNVDTDKIYFGTMPPGNSGSRRFIVENDNNFPERVEILASGELAEWISIRENNFILNKNETKEVRIYVSPPGDAEFGNYTGKLRIAFRKVYISPQLF